jgi:hypothetical protein
MMHDRTVAIGMSRAGFFASSDNVDKASKPVISKKRKKERNKTQSSGKSETYAIQLKILRKLEKKKFQLVITQNTHRRRQMRALQQLP